MHLRAWMQQVEAASYLQQIVMLVFARIVPCISVDSDHGWIFDEQGSTLSPTPRSRHVLLGSLAEHA